MKIGIDLGTTFSAVAYINKNGDPEIIPNRDGGRTTPSVILFEEDGPVVGETAKRDSVLDPLNTVQFVKRSIGSTGFDHEAPWGDVFSAEELSAMILKRLKDDAEDFLGEPVTHAVITVPAYFDDAQRTSTIDAGKIAGLSVLKIINEPTSAALAYATNKSSENEKIMVYDLGGGTFDVTLMDISDNDIQVLATGGDKNLGGFDFDNKIITYALDLFEAEHDICIFDNEEAYQDLRERAEQCKKALSNKSKTSMKIACDGKKMQIDVSQEQFHEMIEPEIDRTIMIMEEVLEDANLTWNDLSKVILVGGSTRIKMVSTEIEKHVPADKISKEVNPDEAVALGAAIQAGLIDENGPIETGSNINVQDVNSHSIGLVCWNSAEEREYNLILIKRNTPIPCSYRDTFTTTSETKINLDISEGEDEDLNYVKIIGSASATFSPPKPIGSPVTIDIKYDVNGIINIVMLDEETDEVICTLDIKRESNLGETEIDIKRKRLEKINIG
ncbi:MAG: Hsp70 family protein [Clostridia bacterium]